jgi:hypothetical protein
VKLEKIAESHFYNVSGEILRGCGGEDARAPSISTTTMHPLPPTHSGDVNDSHFSAEVSVQPPPSPRLTDAEAPVVTGLLVDSLPGGDHIRINKRTMKPVRKYVRKVTSDRGDHSPAADLQDLELPHVFFSEMDNMVTRIAKEANVLDNISNPPKRRRPYRRKVLQIPVGPADFFLEGVSNSPPDRVTGTEHDALNPFHPQVGGPSQPSEVPAFAGLQPRHESQSSVAKKVQNKARCQESKDDMRSSMPLSPEGDDHDIQRTELRHPSKFTPPKTRSSENSSLSPSEALRRCLLQVYCPSTSIASVMRPSGQPGNTANQNSFSIYVAYGFPRDGHEYSTGTSVLCDFHY